MVLGCQQGTPVSEAIMDYLVTKLPGLVKLTNTEPFAAWFVVTGDATADAIHVVRSVLGGFRDKDNM